MSEEDFMKTLIQHYTNEQSLSELNMDMLDMELCLIARSLNKRTLGLETDEQNLETERKSEKYMEEVRDFSCNGEEIHLT